MTHTSAHDAPYQLVSEAEAPVFIVGSMRSGSTLLRLVLDSHPRIAIPSETGFMGGVRALKDIPQWKFGTGWYQRLGWSEQEVDGLLRELYGTLFARYAASQGKPRWGEKTPFHSHHVSEMARIFPNATFVAIVRHPGAVAWSLRKFHYRFDEAVDYWCSTNAALISAGSRLGSRFVLVRYEDLLASPERVLRLLLGALDEPWSDRVLHHDQAQPQQGAPRAVEGNTLTSDPLDATRAHTWATRIDETDRRALAKAATLAAFLGYDVSASATAPEGPGWGLTTGHDLAERSLAWRDRLKLSTESAPPDPDADPRQLARDLARAEQALARTRARRVVRFADAVRTIQKGRSLRAARAAFRRWRAGRGVST